MNTSQLKAGMRIANYKQLCELLELPIKNGKAKRSQLLEIERFIIFKKLPQSKTFVIEKILQSNVTIANELAELPHRKLCSFILTSYMHNLTQIITDGTIFDGAVSISLDKQQLERLMGLVNDDYQLGRETAKTIGKKQFFAEISIKNKEIISYVIKQLQDKGIAQVTRTFQVTFVGQSPMIADEQTVVNILETYSKILDDMNAADKSILFLTNRLREYYTLVNRQLMQDFGIAYHKDVFVFVTSNKLLESYIKRELNNPSFLKKAVRKSNERNTAKLYSHYDKLLLNLTVMKQTDYAGLRTEYYSSISAISEVTHKERIDFINTYVSMLHKELMGMKLIGLEQLIDE